MAYSIKKVDVWSAMIADRPGAVAARLEPLAEAGAQLEFVLARRDKPRTGIVFVAPLKGAAQLQAAKKAGLSKADDLRALRVEGPDKKGLGARLTGALADAGINMRGISAAAIGRKCIFYLAFDSQRDATKAHRVLSKAL